MAKREIKAEVEQNDGVKALPALGEGFTEIKNLFKAGAVPRQLDYERLIEYVHYLHKWLGVEGEDEAHEPALGHGLTTSENGVVCVDTEALVGASLTTDDDNKLSFAAQEAAGPGLIGNGAELAFDTTQVATEGSGLSGIGSTLKFNAAEVAGMGLSAEGSKLKLNPALIAGSGLVVENDRLKVNAGALRLGKVSWFFSQMSRFKATHFALAPIDNDNTVPTVSDAHFILFFTLANSKYVRVRGCATGPNIFDDDPGLMDWWWGNKLPQVDIGKVYADNFSLLYSDKDPIEGSIKIHIKYKSAGGGGVESAERNCQITKLEAGTIIT